VIPLTEATHTPEEACVHEEASIRAAPTNAAPFWPEKTSPSFGTTLCIRYVPGANVKVVPVGFELTAAWTSSPGLSWTPAVWVEPLTVTVADALLVPPLPVTVNVYVVVLVGVTVAEPCAGTVPTPGCRAKVVPFCDDQLRMADCPELIVLGWAVRLAVGVEVFCVAPLTVTVADASLVPPLPVTVKVYVVVCFGVTVVAPCADTLPTPGCRLMVVPSLDDQLRMVDCPALIVAGCAVKLETGAGVAWQPFAAPSHAEFG
jgi:hypothetical protein